MHHLSLLTLANSTYHKHMFTVAVQLFLDLLTKSMVFLVYGTVIVFQTSMQPLSFLLTINSKYHKGVALNSFKNRNKQKQ